MGSASCFVKVGHCERYAGRASGGDGRCGKGVGRASEKKNQEGGGFQHGGVGTCFVCSD